MCAAHANFGREKPLTIGLCCCHGRSNHPWAPAACWRAVLQAVLQRAPGYGRAGCAAFAAEARCRLCAATSTRPRCCQGPMSQQPMSQPLRCRRPRPRLPLHLEVAVGAWAAQWICLWVVATRRVSVGRRRCRRASPSFGRGADLAAGCCASLQFSAGRASLSVSSFGRFTELLCRWGARGGAHLHRAPLDHYTSRLRISVTARRPSAHTAPRWRMGVRKRASTGAAGHPPSSATASPRINGDSRTAGVLARHCPRHVCDAAAVHPTERRRRSPPQRIKTDSSSTKVSLLTPQPAQGPS